MPSNLITTPWPVLLQKLKTDEQTNLEQARAGSYANTAAARGNLVGGAGAGLASAFSDEDLKTDIEEDDGKKGFLSDFLKGFALDKPKQDKEKYNGQAQAGQAMGSGAAQAFGLGKYASKDAGTGTTVAAGVDAPASSALSEAAMLAFKGGVVPGEAEVEGDSPVNDKVPLKVSPGEAVIPRSAMEDPKKLDEFVSNLKAYKYKYKDPAHGDGTYVSPMAQDLEKSELGKSMVIDTPEGKLVDYSRAAGTMLATAAMLNDRMEDLEKAFEERRKKRA